MKRGENNVTGKRTNPRTNPLSRRESMARTPGPKEKQMQQLREQQAAKQELTDQDRKDFDVAVEEARQEKVKGAPAEIKARAQWPEEDIAFSKSEIDERSMNLVKAGKIDIKEAREAGLKGLSATRLAELEPQVDEKDAKAIRKALQAQKISQRGAAEAWRGEITLDEAKEKGREYAEEQPKAKKGGGKKTVRNDNPASKSKINAPVFLDGATYGNVKVEQGTEVWIRAIAYTNKSRKNRAEAVMVRQDVDEAKLKNIEFDADGPKQNGTVRNMRFVGLDEVTFRYGNEDLPAATVEKEVEKEVPVYITPEDDKVRSSLERRYREACDVSNDLEASKAAKMRAEKMQQMISEMASEMGVEMDFSAIDLEKLQKGGREGQTVAKS